MTSPLLTEVFYLGKRELAILEPKISLLPGTVLLLLPNIWHTLQFSQTSLGNIRKRKADAQIERQLLLCGSHPTSSRLVFPGHFLVGIHLLGRCSYIFASSASKPATKHQTFVLYILVDNLILFLKTLQSFLLCQNYLLCALNISLL